MRKYIITESQLGLIVKNASDSQLNETSVQDSSTPISFDEFLKATEVDNIKNNVNAKPNNPDDIKAFVQAQIASVGSNKGAEMTDKALKDIAGEHYMDYHRGYRIEPFDEVDNLSIIVCSIVYFYYKEGKIASFNLKDVYSSWDANYRYLQKNGIDNGKLKQLLRTKFKADLNALPTIDSDKEVTLISKDGSISAQVLKSNKDITRVSFNFLDKNGLDYFYSTFLRNGNNLKNIRLAIGRNVTPSLDKGSLIFKF